jgi:TolB protein
MKVVYCSDKHEITNASGRPQHLLVYDIGTGIRTKLTQGESFDINPEFSPDGNWIVYSSDERQSGSFNFWKISKNGSQKIKIPNNLNLTSSSIGNLALGRPTWSSDGNFIFFNIISEYKSQNGIYQINLQNNNINPVIKSRWRDMCPSVSPDNTNIAFISNRSGTNQIWVYNLNTRLLRQITGSKVNNLNTDWGKIEWLDNTKLLYSGYSLTDSKETIFTIDLK